MACYAILRVAPEGFKIPYSETCTGETGVSETSIVNNLEFCDQIWGEIKLIEHLRESSSTLN